MSHRIAVLLILLGLILPVPAALADTAPAAVAPTAAAITTQDKDIGEGYAKPTFMEVVQTAVMLNAFDLNDPKIADEYARIVYCSLYQKNFSNDIAWRRIREQISLRAQKKKEYFRVKYEVVSAFTLGRYDFAKQFFPIDAKEAITNVGSVSLLNTHFSTDCMGQNIESKIFPPNAVVELNDPLTVAGFYVPANKVEKMMVRIEEAGNTNRRIYGRIRVIVNDAKKGIDYDGNFAQMLLKGHVTSVDFFIDPELTKPIGGVQLSHE